MVTFFSFLVIYNYVIPISLYVTVEMHRFISAFFISWDEKFNFTSIDGEHLHAKVNCSDINDELGQINYVLSDKTGTLTENEMNFKACYSAQDHERWLVYSCKFHPISPVLHHQCRRSLH